MEIGETVAPPVITQSDDVGRDPYGAVQRVEESNDERFQRLEHQFALLQDSVASFMLSDKSDGRRSHSDRPTYDRPPVSSPRSNQPPPNRRPNRRGTTRDGAIVCFNCGRTGHIARDCRRSKHPQRSNTTSHAVREERFARKGSRPLN